MNFKYDDLDLHKNEKKKYKAEISQSIAYAIKNEEQKRCLTTRVTSRWYRAPEIILTEREYS